MLVHASMKLKKKRNKRFMSFLCQDVKIQSLESRCTICILSFIYIYFKKKGKSVEVFKVDSSEE